VNGQSQEPTRQIVIFEDNPADVMLIKRSLANAGIPFAATVIDNGGTALRYVSACSASHRPDLILIDLNLPEYDGFEIVEAIGRNPALSDVPFAILTSSVSDRDRDRAKKMGVAQFVSKPSDIDDFLQTGLLFKSLIERRR